MEFAVFDLGLLDFEKAWLIQKQTFEDVKSGRLKSAMIFCQHYPVITLGRRANKKNILISEEELSERKIKACQIERGGDVTYHGPGQLMFYPILNLNYFKKDIHWFLRSLEKIVIGLLNEFGILADRIHGLTGVWLGDKKIASVGITVKNWITYHGVALNVRRDDLENFSLIRPCGADTRMTSVESSLGRRIGVGQVKEALKRRLQNDKSSFA